jgi:methionine-S-sulfoxide reductase
LKTKVGFTGGHTSNPSYKEVCRKETGHAEAVEVTYDPEQTTFAELARYFFNMHDPTVDRTGRGGQYRSAIFYHDEDQLAAAKKLMHQLSQNGYRVATTLKPAGEFWPAEARHQKYCEARGMNPQDRFTPRLQMN